ncbi:MAG: hypothetical protein JWM11_7669, partial [Planctomycetaceae bacterium]|nr:hypothetical protein [Planctomycetaceae bacterium]
MTSDFDPYHKWLGIAPAEQPPSHYRLLGVPEFESDPQVIEAAADRQLTYLRKQQSGSHQREASDLLNEVTRARRVLVKPDSRTAYDATLSNSSPRGRAAQAGTDANSQRTAIWVGTGLVSLIALAGMLFWILRTPTPPSQTDATAKAAEIPTEPANSNPPAVSLPDPQQVSISQTGANPPDAAQEASSQPAPRNTRIAATDKPAASSMTEKRASQPAAPAKDSAKAPAKDIVIAQASAKQVQEKKPEAPVAPVEATAKPAVPDKAAQTEAKKTVKEKFKSEYAQAKKPAGKIALATALIEKAGEIEEATVVRYVMLSDALELAAEAADAALAQQAMDELEKLFNVRPFELKERVLSAATFTGKTYDEGTLLLMQYSDLAQAAAKAEDYATSVKAMLSAVTSLKRPLFKPLKDFAALEVKRYTAYQDAYTVAKTSRDKLVSDPADPAASLVWGRFLCCYLGNWEAGLPLLAQSEDKIWKPLAERELKKPTQPAALMQLGDDWLKAGEKEKDPVQFQTRERANLAWEEALASCQELERSKFALQLDQRLAKLFDKSLAVSKDENGVPLLGTESMDPSTEFTIEFWVATSSKQGTVI